MLHKDVMAVLGVQMKNHWLNSVYYDENNAGWYSHDTKTRITKRINRQVGQSFMTAEEVRIENDYDIFVGNTEFWDATARQIADRLKTAYETGIMDQQDGLAANNEYGNIAGYAAGIKATQAFYDGGYNGIEAKDVVADRPSYFALPWFTKEQMEYNAASPFHLWDNLLSEKPKKTSKMALEGATKLYSREYIKEHYEKSLVK
jgi:hypothetical protein